MKTLTAIVRGLGYVEGYGNHPGLPILTIFVIMGAVAGGFIGAFVMLVMFGSLVLVGAYERGKR